MLAGCSESEGGADPAPIAWQDVAQAPLRGESDGGAGLDGRVDPGPEDRSYGLPLMRITGSAQELTRIHERFEEEITILVDVTWRGQQWSGVKLELHGGFARTVPKKSYRLVFPDDDHLEGDLFGDGDSKAYRRVVLQASWIDQTFMRNKLTMDLMRVMGGLSPRLGYIILEMNGEWLGLYQTIERVDRQYLEREKLDKDGNLYKAESHWANWKSKEDPLAGYDIQEGEENPHEALGELLDALTYTPTEVTDFEQEVAPRLDLEGFMTWQVVHTLAMNADTFTKNYYLYHDVDASPGSDKARFRIISWDADATWGNSWDGTVLTPDLESWFGTDAFSPRLMSVPEYRDWYLTFYGSALDDELAAPGILLRVAAIESLIGLAAQADLERWERESTFAEELDRLRKGVAERVDTMQGVIAAKRASP
ncbi:MAG: hypothetical protein CL940_12550 [Deltaproteobacteria bacterium]|nr:hypothetical protein [Deltaproteobacteria bacterium]